MNIKYEIKDGNFIYQIFEDGHLEIFHFYDSVNWKTLSIPNIKILRNFLNKDGK